MTSILGSILVSKLLIILQIVMIAVVIVGCATSNPNQTPWITDSPQASTQSAYPYPMELPMTPVLNSAYPGPIEDNETLNITPTHSNIVTELIIPTPSSGNAVITGQLLVGGDQNQPLITSLYLASTIPASTPGASSIVNLLKESDPIAIQDVRTGRFMFGDVPPGQYALVVLTVVGEYALKDSAGNIIIFTVNPGETKDLGVITIQ
jgi:hypothetical protein